jgi:hypothetical protein
VFAAALLSPLRTAASQASSAVDQLAFDKSDRRAQRVLWSLRCARSVSMARARREFGPLDSLGHIGQCVYLDGRTVGVFMDADSQFVRTTRFSAVDLDSHERRTAPMDTMAVLAMARAELTAHARGGPAFLAEKRQYSPMVFRFDGDSIEVWLIPTSLLMGPSLTLGGERGYLFSPDGRTLVREVDASADYRSVVVPDTGAVNIVSRSASLPSLSELVLANGLNSRGRNVAIIWGSVSSVLAGQGSQAAWLHVAR